MLSSPAVTLQQTDTVTGSNTSKDPKETVFSRGNGYDGNSWPSLLRKSHLERMTIAEANQPRFRLVPEGNSVLPCPFGLVL
jgi:hypothetical protein